MDPRLLFAGMAIGLAVTAPLGPVNVFVIRNAIRHGFTAAFLIGLGAVAGDLLYAAAAAYGVSWVSELMSAHGRLLLLVGGLLLVITGVWLSRKRLDIASIRSDDPQGMKLIGKVLAAFGLTISNPGELFGLIAIFGTMNGLLRLHEDWTRPLIVIAGVAIGCVSWWLFVSFAVSRLKARISERALALISRWTGILIAAFGFALLMEALF